MNTPYTDEIITLKAQTPGPTLALFVGVHGNEQVGVMAVQELLPSLKLSRGTLHVAYANPPALAQNVRMINQNLNRCFTPNIDSSTYEGKRARQLMAVLDTCDALLDLHAFNEPEGEPFVICAPDALPVAATFETKILSTGWTQAEPGATDGYMHQAGKVGICFECGPLSRPTEFMGVAIAAIKQFLSYYRMLEEPIPLSTMPKRVIRADYSITREKGDFWLDPSLLSFKRLQPGQLIARQNGREFRAESGDFIIFPRPNAPIGGEVFIIGRDEGVYTGKQ